MGKSRQWRKIWGKCEGIFIMHGRALRGGEFCERRRFGQHMPATTTRTVAAGDSCLTSVTADSFCKVLPWWVFQFS